MVRDTRWTMLRQFRGVFCEGRAREIGYPRGVKKKLREKIVTEEKDLL